MDHLPLMLADVSLYGALLGSFFLLRLTLPVVVTSVDSKQLGLKIQMLIRLGAIGLVRDLHITPRLPPFFMIDPSSSVMKCHF